MEKKAFTEALAEYNRQIKELQQNAKTITSKEDLAEYNKKVDFVLSEKMKLEKQQLEDLKKIEKARLAKKTNQVNARLRKERTHRLCVIGGMIEHKLGDTADPVLYENILNYLDHRWFKRGFDQYMEKEVNAVKNEEQEVAAPEESEPQQQKQEIPETKPFVNFPPLDSFKNEN